MTALAGEEASRREPRLANRYFFKMMLSYCLVIFVGLGLVAVLTTSRVVGALTEKELRMDSEMVQQVQTYSDEKYRTLVALPLGGVDTVIQVMLLSSSWDQTKTFHGSTFFA